jgi:hypothetical protein
MTAIEKDRDILARTIWGEARGECTAGQIGVAWTSEPQPQPQPQPQPHRERLRGGDLPEPMTTDNQL